MFKTFVLRAFVTLLAFCPQSSFGQEDGSQSQTMQLLGLEEQTVAAPEASASRYAFSLSFEPGVITSKVNNGYEDVTGADGYGFSIEAWQLKNGKGAGLTYSQSRTDYDSTPLKLYFGGASYMWRSELRNHLAVSAAIGLGFAYFSYSSPHRYGYLDERESQGGIGFMVRGGLEYLPVKFVGIALDLRNTVHIFPGAEPAEDKGIPGFVRLSLNLGLRFHI